MTISGSAESRDEIGGGIGERIGIPHVAGVDRCATGREGRRQRVEFGAASREQSEGCTLRGVLPRERAPRPKPLLAPVMRKTLRGQCPAFERLRPLGARLCDQRVDQRRQCAMGASTRLLTNLPSTTISGTDWI